MCSFDECGRPAEKRGWCNRHYKRWLRSGDPAGVRPLRQEVPADRRCTLPECDAEYYGQGFCKPHWQHHHRAGDPRLVRPRSPSGEANKRWRGDEVGYVGAHGRVRRARGPASAHQCAHASSECHGRMEWANLTGNYPDTGDYMPLCAAHHRRFDAAARAAS